jgi:hypothetical protein
MFDDLQVSGNIHITWQSYDLEIEENENYTFAREFEKMIA